MFTDLVGSAALFARRGDEAADVVRREHFAALRRAVADSGGREVKTTGDGLMVVFASAVAALRCAVAMQRATGVVGPLELRIGLDAGEPLPEGEDLYGTPVIVAARLCEAAEAGEILASEVVCRVAGPRITEQIQPAGACACAGSASGGDLPGALAGRRRARGGAAVTATADQRRRGRRPAARALGFRVIIDAEPDMRVVGEARDGRNAVNVVRRTQPDVVLDGHPHAGAQRPPGGRAHPLGRQARDRGADADDVDRDEYVYEALPSVPAASCSRTPPQTGCWTRCEWRPPATRCWRPRSRGG